MVPPVVGVSYNNHARRIPVDTAPLCHGILDDIYGSSSRHHRQSPLVLSASFHTDHVQTLLIHQSIRVFTQSCYHLVHCPLSQDK